MLKVITDPTDMMITWNQISYNTGKYVPHDMHGLKPDTHSFNEVHSPAIAIHPNASSDNGTDDHDEM